MLVGIKQYSGMSAIEPLLFVSKLVQTDKNEMNTSRISDCFEGSPPVNAFNDRQFCNRWQEATKLMLNFNTETSNFVILSNLRDLGV